ncbi:ERAD-associated protein [Myotisia sp. PD_48]|nr:ERAD-associated protein [Myotisia sp. PD_48]
MIRLWRWLFLLQALVFTAAQVPRDDSTATTTTTSTATSTATSIQSHESVSFDSHVIKIQGGSGGHGSSDEQPAVDAACNILRKLKVPPRKYERPSGLFGYASHYATELFYALFMNGPTTTTHTFTSSQQKSSKLVEAVRLLEGAAAENNSDALFLLAEMNFYGNFTHPRDYSKAFQYYETLAKATGNTTAQHMLGFMYATGIGGAVEMDQGRALLYHTFAAMGGNIRSQATLAYRRYAGIGTPRDCDAAAYWYKEVADKAMEWFRSGPPGGRSYTRGAYRWADEEGGVYGEGASVSSSGPNAHRDGYHSSSDASLDDVLEYLDLLAKKGDAKATFSLGKMHYDGSRNFEKNYRKAMIYFVSVARRYWTKDGKINPNHPTGIDKIAAKSAGHIGIMFLRGEGTEQNFDKAMTWFKRGRANGDPICQHFLGLMYLRGYGVEPDVLKAVTYFKAASDQDYFPSATRLGALFLDQGDVTTATRYFELAARYGGMESFYYLAEIANRGIGGERHCGVATAYYKMVVEKAEPIHSSFTEANEAYLSGDKELALISSLMAAEQGYETAQANVAFLLDEKRSVFSLDPVLPWSSKRRSSLLKNAALGLIYWTRSAAQANVDSMVKMGDYYFEGFGTKVDLAKASTCYHSAAESRSAQAFWNLGWMYENGLSVDQDFPMAKRYYDLALETNEEAYLPVTLSLMRLRIRNFWNRVTRGKANSIQSEADTNNTPRTFKEWIAAFIRSSQEEEGYQRTTAGDHADGMLDDAGNPVDATTHAHDGFYDELDVDVDDGMVESLVILGLAAALVLLLHFRQQRVLRRAEQNNNNNVNNNNANQNPINFNVQNAQEPAREEDRGMFPRPGDPDYAAWVAGGVGH